MKCKRKLAIVLAQIMTVCMVLVMDVVPVKADTTNGIYLGTSMETATPLELEKLYSINHTNTNEMDWASFETKPKEGYYRFKTITNKSDVMLSCYIYDSNLNLVKELTPFVRWAGDSYTYSFRLKPSSKYYIKLCYFLTDGDANYSFYLDYDADPEADDFSDAKTVKVGKTQNGTLASNDDIDFYKIKAKKGTYSFSVKNKKDEDVDANSAVFFQIYDSEMNLVYSTKPGEMGLYAEQVGVSSGSTTYKLKSKTYYVKVYSYKGDAYGSQYSFKLKKVK